MDYDRIKKLISLVEESEISGLKIEEDDVKIEITKKAETVIVQGASSSAPAPVAAAPSPVAVTTPDARDAGLVAITSPMVGTYYAASKPGAPSYVKLGDSVGKGSVVCMIEAMKLFNEIESEVSGTLEKVLIEDGQPVEYGQELFLVRVN